MKTLIILFVLISPFFVFSQVPDKQAGNGPDSLDKRSNAESMFINYDPRPPEFPGGLNSFLKFQRENLHYPKNEWNSGIQGRVIIGVIIEKDGSITHVQVLRNISPAIDSEAVRVIRLSPKWMPAKYYVPKGSPEKPARIGYTLPVAFKIIKGRKIEDAFKEPYF